MYESDPAPKIEAFWDQEALSQSRYSAPCLDLTSSLVEEYAYGSLKELPDATVYPRRVVHDIRGKRVLCLASGGGQQSAVFGLLGAHVTVLGISEGQLQGDRVAATHYGYDVTLVKGDMRNLSMFLDASFDLVYQQISICFVPDVREVYQQVRRILIAGGTYAVAHINPAVFPTSFTGGSNGWEGSGYRIAERYVGGPVRVTADGVENMCEGEPTGEYRHLLKDIFGGLIEAGFRICEVVEDPRHLAEPSVAEGGSHEHFLSVIAEYFTIVSAKA